MCLPLDNKIATTTEGKKSVQRLQLIAFIQCALLFIRCIIDFNMSNLYELLLILCLWQAWATLSYCLCQLYIMYSLYKALLIFVFFGTRLQHGDPLLPPEPIQRVILTLQLVTFLFYLIAQYVVFLAYREFRAIEEEQSFMVATDQERQPFQPTYQEQRVFAGAGIRIG